MWPSMRIAEELAGQYEGQPADTPLPSERLLAKHFGVQRPTVRVALEHLAQRGTIYRRERSGWFVNRPRIRYNPLVPPVAPSDRRHVEVVTTDPEGQPPPPYPNLAFLALRKYFLDGRLIVAEHLYLRPDLVEALAGTDLTRRVVDYLADLGQRCGVDVTHDRLDLVPAVVGSELAATLEMPSRSSMLEITRVHYSGKEVIGVDLEHWRSDVVTVTIDTRYTS